MFSDMCSIMVFYSVLWFRWYSMVNMMLLMFVIVNMCSVMLLLLLKDY